MISSFEGFLYRKINEGLEQPQAPGAKPGAGGGLMKALAGAVQAHAHTDPLLTHITSDPNEFQEFLMSAHYVLKAMHPEEREMVASGPQGMQMLLNRMIADYKQRSPELRQSDVQAGYEKRWGAPKGDPGPGMRTHPAHTPSGRKLLELVIAAYGQAKFKPMADKLVAIFVSNGQAKVDQWASQINTPEEMKAKIADWQKRGLV